MVVIRLAAKTLPRRPAGYGENTFSPSAVRTYKITPAHVSRTLTHTHTRVYRHDGLRMFLINYFGFSTPIRVTAAFISRPPDCTRPRVRRFRFQKCPKIFLEERGRGGVIRTVPMIKNINLKYSIETVPLNRFVVVRKLNIDKCTKINKFKSRDRYDEIKKYVPPKNPPLAILFPTISSITEIPFEP